MLSHLDAAIMIGVLAKNNGRSYQENPFCPVQSPSFYWGWLSGFSDEECPFNIHSKNSLLETGCGDA